MKSNQIFCLCALCSSVSSFSSQPAHADAPATGESEHQFIEEMVVIAHPLSGEGFAQPTSVLDGEELNRAVAGTLGETLINQPGIHSATFGQAVGRPVIRGMSGPRVKVMEDRIDSMDVSVSSPDHATTVEPFIADRIEVLKGPSTLLYGNGAIGGVVDVHTGRIPHTQSERTEAKAELRGADNADARTAAGMVKTGTGNFALHLDGSYRDADEYEIPDYAESKALRDAEEEGEEDDDQHEAKGTLPGSELNTKGGALGLSYVREGGFIGAAVSRYDATYGLPGSHHAHEDTEEEDLDEGTPKLDMKQTRYDIEAGISEPFTGAESLNLRLGWNDYEHKEIEPDGSIGTVFTNEALEGRIEIVHSAVAEVTGAAGIQFGNRDYSAVGEEAYVPPVKTDSFGLFYVGQRSFQWMDLEAGVRFERVSHDLDAGTSTDFDLGAASLGLISAFESGLTLAVLLDYSTRAPTVEELYSDGPHLATSSYEIGDPELNEEKAGNVSVSLQYENDRWLLAGSAYYTDFRDFIFEQPTGAEIEELPVFQWQQAGATFQGLDLEARWHAMRWSEGELTLRGFYDRVRARLKKGEDRDLPRIPPERWGLGLTLNWQQATATLDYTRTSKQTDLAQFELPTDGFEDLRAYLGYSFAWGVNTLEVFLAGRNLTDDEQRHHTSFIKDFAPQPGRTIEGGVRLQL